MIMVLHAAGRATSRRLASLGAARARRFAPSSLRVEAGIAALRAGSRPGHLLGVRACVQAGQAGQAGGRVASPVTYVYPSEIHLQRALVSCLSLPDQWAGQAAD